ncbi:MAG TPA: cytochrome c, partial [Acidimicrobiia bacterium]|nr:cytochrome c [Acidimicrobiia bacterium]
ECQSCHGGITGGEITDIPPPHNAEGHTWHHPDCQLVDITLGGLPERPGVPEGMAMPAFEERLTVEQIQYVLAFIKTLWTQEQREWQAEVTERLCP